VQQQLASARPKGASQAQGGASNACSGRFERKSVKRSQPRRFKRRAEISAGEHERASDILANDEYRGNFFVLPKCY
jgi:hypothetical protein